MFSSVNRLGAFRAAACAVALAAAFSSAVGAQSTRTVRDGVRERMGGNGEALDVDADLADTEADVETVETEAITAAHVAADEMKTVAATEAADGSEEIAAPH